MKKILTRCSIAVALCLLIGFLAAAATETFVSGWYATLEKPFFSPPRWMFEPIWYTVYFVLGIAAGIVWSKGFYHKWVKVALYHFGFVLILTGSWPIIFFGLQKTLLSMLNLVVLFVVLLISIKWFKIVSSKGTYLLYIFGAWVLYVLLLNFEIWRLN